MPYRVKNRPLAFPASGNYFEIHGHHSKKEMTQYAPLIPTHKIGLEQQTKLIPSCKSSKNISTYTIGCICAFSRRWAPYD